MDTTHEHNFLDYPDGKKCPCGASQTASDASTASTTDIPPSDFHDGTPTEGKVPSENVTVEAPQTEPVQESAATELPTEDTVPTDPTESYFNKMRTDLGVVQDSLNAFRSSNTQLAARTVSLAITKIQEARMWIKEALDELGFKAE